MAAANFLILGVIISRLGVQYSRLSPRWCASPSFPGHALALPDKVPDSIVFITADVVALTVQGVGGGVASSAATDPAGDPDSGARIMVGGIIWQLAAMTIYALLAIEFFIRVMLDRPVRTPKEVMRAVPALGGTPRKRNGWSLHDHSYDSALATASAQEVRKNGFGFSRVSKLSLMILALGISTMFIYMRSIYRTIELLGGWSGRIITTEVYFNVLDAMPITLALLTLNALHPGWLLYGKGTGRHPCGGLEMMETDEQAMVEHEVRG
jgi:hypothetical protein